MAREPARKDVTAYVLGELELEETTQLEIELGADAELKREVEELRTLSDLLTSEFKRAEKLSLHPDQRQAILAATARPRTSAPRARKPTETVSTRAVAPPTPAPVDTVLTEEGETAPIELWERLELLLVHLGLVTIGLTLPRFPAYVDGLQSLAGRVSGRDFEPVDPETWGNLGFPPGEAPVFFKLVLASAVVATLAYAGVRLSAYRRQPVPLLFIVALAAAHLALILFAFRMLA